MATGRGVVRALLGAGVTGRDEDGNAFGGELLQYWLIRRRVGRILTDAP